MCDLREARVRVCRAEREKAGASASRASTRRASGREMKEYGLARKAAGKTKIDARRAAATVHGMSEYEPHPEDAALYDQANVHLQTRHRGVPSEYAIN